MMFLVAEVHPFADGNGRVARVMMNAELIAGGQQRTHAQHKGEKRAIPNQTEVQASDGMVRDTYNAVFGH